MEKSSTKQIRDDEKKILVALMKNSKENIEKITNECGFSKRKVWRIINQLEAKKLIWGYSTVFDEQQIGLEHFTLMIKRTTKPLEDKTAERIISRQLMDRGTEFGATIESSAYVHGDYDWIVTFTAQSIFQAKNFANSLVQLYPGDIEKTAIMQTLMFIRKHYILNPESIKLKDFL